MSRGRVLPLLACCVLLAGRGAAQTADTLVRARQLYDSLAVERAIPTLRALLAPSWPFPVSIPERVTAEEYLGASFALLNARDSALHAFRAAVETDPFADLDPQRFTPSQVGLFHEAQDSIFAVGLRPADSARIDPRIEHVVLRVVSTHSASLHVLLRTPGRDTIPLFDGPNAGFRLVEWDALLSDGSFAPSGRYEVVARATSLIAHRTDSTRIFFDLKRDGPVLADTLPSLNAGDLVAVRYAKPEVWHDLVRGLALGVGTVALGVALPNRAVDGAHTRAAIVAGVALFAAGGTVLYRRGHPDLPAAVAENARRNAARAAENARIRQENADRLNEARLVITPAAGTVP